MKAERQLAVAKVVLPSNQILTEFLDHLPYAPTTSTPRDLPDLSLETLDGCLAKKQTKAAAAETETKELPFPRPSDRALGFVDLKLQLARKESGKAFQYPSFQPVDYARRCYSRRHNEQIDGPASPVPGPIHPGAD